MKTCTKCGEEKPLDAFGRDKHKKDGRMGSCKQCRSINRREATRRYYAGVMSDPERRKKQNEASLKNYYKNKPAYHAASVKRRAAKVSQTPSWASEQLIAAYYKEAKRLEELTGIKFHVDHIIPLQGELVSGLHVETNLQLLPAHENIGKSNSFDPETFVA